MSEQVPAAAPTDPAKAAAQPAAGAAPVDGKAPAPVVEEKSSDSILGPADDGGDASDQSAVDKGKPGQSDSAELEIKLPEGAKVDETKLKAAKAVFKEAGLSSEAASKIVAWHLKQEQSDYEAFEAKWRKQGEDWLASIKADKDLGGERFKETASLAHKAMAKFGGADLAKDLEARGLSNHPGLVRFFAQVGKALKEDDSAAGGAPASTKTRESPEQRSTRLYPVTAKQRATQKAG
jgi:hypothetical protein